MLCNSFDGVCKKVLYETIDQMLPNKLIGPLHYTVGSYICIQWARVLYSVVIP